MILAKYGIKISESKFVSRATILAGEDDYTYVYVVKNTINWFLKDAGLSTRYQYVNVKSYSQKDYENLVIKNIMNSHPVEPVLKITSSTTGFPYSSSGHYVVIKGMVYPDSNGYKAVINDSHPTHSNVYNVSIGNIFSYNKAHGGYIICVDT